MPEVLASLGLTIQLAWWDIVAHAVDLVVSPPQLSSYRMEVLTDRVTYTVSVDLAVFAVAIHTDDATDACLFVKIHLGTWRHVVWLA